MKVITTIAILAFNISQINGQIFEKKSNMTSAGRDGGVAFSSTSKVYFAAGVGFKDLWEYDPAINQWQNKGLVPGVSNERAFGVGVSIGTKAYIGLGYDGSTNLKSDWWEYDMLSNSWNQKANFPGTARDACVSFAVNGKIYVGGGTDNTYMFADYYEYDPSNDTWTNKGNLPGGEVAFPFCFTIGNKAYLVCGSNGSTETNALYEFNQPTNTWTTKTAFPGSPRQAGFAFSINQEGIIGHGMSGYTTIFNDVYKYSPLNDSWSLLSPINNPDARCWVPATTLNNKAYVGTGLTDFSPFTFTNTFYEYKPTSNSIKFNNYIESDFLITHNPIADFIEVHSKKNEPFNIRIFEPSGRTLSDMHCTQSTKIYLPIQCSPLLFVWIEDNKGDYFIRKMVIN